MSLPITTAWTLKAPDLTIWTPSITDQGIVTWTAGGPELTPTPPVFQSDDPDLVWIPSIDNNGIVSATQQAIAAGQNWACLYSPDANLWYWMVDLDGFIRVTKVPPLGTLVSAAGPALGSLPLGDAPLAGAIGPGIPLTGIGLRIGAYDATPYLLIETYDIKEALNQTNTCEVQLTITGTAWYPRLGEEFVLTRFGGRLFAGSVNDLQQAPIAESRPGHRHVNVTAVGFDQICARRLVAKAYEQQSCGTIVRDLLDTYLAADGIVEGHIDDGPVLEKFQVNYRSVAETLNTLAELAGYAWTIDYWKNLYFMSRMYRAAPYTIDSSNAVFRDLAQDQTRDQYRNRQYIRGGTAITDLQFEKKQGDGANQSFIYGYPFDSVPLVARNSTSTGDATETVEVQSQQIQANWYWRRGEGTLQQHSTDPVLTSTEFLSVWYYGQFPLIGIQTDAALVADRAAVEGGSGLYEAVDQDDNVDTEALAFAKLGGLLEKYGVLKEDVHFSTVQIEPRLGDLITLNVPEWNLAGQYLATEVRCSDWRMGLQRKYEVTCTNGQVRGTFAEFFNALMRAGKPLITRENEVVSQPLIFDETVAVSDVLTATPAAAGPAKYYGYMEYGTGEYGP